MLVTSSLMFVLSTACLPDVPPGERVGQQDSDAAPPGNGDPDKFGPHGDAGIPESADAAVPPPVQNVIDTISRVCAGKYPNRGSCVSCVARAAPTDEAIPFYAQGYCRDECIPQTVATACTGLCGSQSDGCGGTLDCGPCCIPRTVAAACADRCGPTRDGCGGTIDCPCVPPPSGCTFGPNCLPVFP
jgi:hypothetical protein